MAFLKRQGYATEVIHREYDLLSDEDRMQGFVNFTKEVMQLLIFVNQAYKVSQEGGDMRPFDELELIQQLEGYLGFRLSEITMSRYFDFVIDLSTVLGIDVSAYPHILRGARYAHGMESFTRNGGSLGAIAEIEQVDRDVKQALAESEESREVLRMHYHFVHMRLLMQLREAPEAVVEDIGFVGYAVNRRDQTLDEFLTYDEFLKLCSKKDLKRIKKNSTRI